MKQLLDAGLLHGDCRTIEGKTLKELLADVPSTTPAGQDVIGSISNPLYQKGHLAILKGNLASEGSVAKISRKTPVLTGPARVFESEETCLAAILDRQIKLMWWWFAMRDPWVVRGCVKCSRPPRQSSVRGSVKKWR